MKNKNNELILRDAWRFHRNKIKLFKKLNEFWHLYKITNPPLYYTNQDHSKPQQSARNSDTKNNSYLDIVKFSF